MDHGVILDLETTGLSSDKDKIIEIGLLEFVLGESGIPQITNLYGALEDPMQPLSPEIQKLTGLTDEALKGQKINWPYVREILERSSIVIAHNAAFDSAFCAQREELVGLNLHWGCSQKHIDWEGKGHRTKALNYLAADHGFVNPFAHRALFDCATTFRVMEPYFAELVERSYLNEVRVWATGAAFETKEKLRLARYRWDAGVRVWFKDILEDTLEMERAFLRSEIYPEGRDSHKIEILKVVRSSEAVSEEL